jgi:protein tyrosine phosphatase (PTP) superfamily phosphohydrolase (DUF442 family)
MIKYVQLTNAGATVNRSSLYLIVFIAAIAGVALVRPVLSEINPTSDSTGAASSRARPQLMPELPGIHNLMKISARIYSGSEPHGEEGFASLAMLGVKTVVSVDGAKPKVELARKHGLRYVHIPIGYDSVPEEAALSLARAVRDAKPPLYIHCHHGKHRGPAAAAVACIASGDIQGKDAIQILVRAGTSKDYKGLWRDVEAYEPPPADAQLPELVEIAEVGSFTAAMAQVDRAYDNLKLSRDAKWGVPPDHPDIVPDQEALLLQEGLHEAARNANGGYDEQFTKWLAEAEAAATNLRQDLQAKDLPSANDRFMRLDAACKQCHKSYRD